MGGRNYDRAREFGIEPIIRGVSHDSIKQIDQAKRNLEPYYKKVGRGKALELGGVAITTFNMFDSYDLHMRLKDIPRTSEVIAKVPSLREDISICIEGIGLYGLDKRPKLGIELLSEKLDAEFQAIREVYLEHDIELRTDLLEDRNAADAYFHYSFAEVRSDAKERLILPRVRTSMLEYSQLAGQTFILTPPPQA